MKTSETEFGWLNSCVLYMALNTRALPELYLLVA